MEYYEKKTEQSKRMIKETQEELEDVNETIRILEQ